MSLLKLEHTNTCLRFGANFAMCVRVCVFRFAWFFLLSIFLPCGKLIEPLDCSKVLPIQSFLFRCMCVCKASRFRCAPLPTYRLYRSLFSIFAWLGGGFCRPLNDHCRSIAKKTVRRRERDFEWACHQSPEWIDINLPIITQLNGCVSPSSRWLP